jgi:cysteine desulfurase
MDNHATTPVDPRVLDAMMPYFTEKFGNAASRNHTFGFDAENAVELARKQIAALIGADHREIVFTSGATESDNLAVKGVAAMYREKGNHIITCVTEHKAILDSCKHLEKEGYKVTFLPVNDKGLVSLEDLRAAITDQTVLISIMTANNEVGVIQDVKAIGQIARERGVLFHTDAVQAAGKIPFNVNDLNVDLASLSAHKMYGPKGVGALYVRRRNPRVLLTPIIDGGGHERGMRSGTLNVPGIVGFGKAAQIALEELDKETAEMFRLREKLRTTLERELDEVYINGDLTKRLPGNLNMSCLCRRGISVDGHQ